MTSPYASLDSRLRSLPDAVTVAVGLAMIAGLTLLGLQPAHSVPLDDFFFIPVVWVGWLAHRRAYGYAIALAAAVASVAMAVAGPDAMGLGAAVIAGAARLFLFLLLLGLLTAMHRLQLAHETDARTDALTGAANSRAFGDLAGAEVERTQRYRHRLSLAYVDVDDFKRINDLEGHAQGDRVLRLLGEAMRSAVRSVDTVARLGGDEFVILMPETGAAEARAVTERLTGDLAGLATKAGRRVTCSIGLVTFDVPPGSVQELVDAGDELMYKAKHGGKNSIEQAARAGSFRVRETA